MYTYLQRLNFIDKMTKHPLLTLGKWRMYSQYQDKKNQNHGEEMRWGKKEKMEDKRKENVLIE